MRVHRAWRALLLVPVVVIAQPACQLLSGVNDLEFSAGGSDASASGGSGAASGAAGAAADCTLASDCAGVDDECKTRSCSAGKCGFDYASPGTELSAQTPGDCKRMVCDGLGGVTSEDEDNDVKDDGKDCTTDFCIDGVPGHENLPNTTQCGTSASTKCDGAGNCVGCTFPSDCAGTECSNAACDNGTCTLAPKPNTTPCGVGASCQGQFAQPASHCDGAGICVVPGKQDCTPYVCDIDGCKTECKLDVDCATGYDCKSGTQCKKKLNGVACLYAIECESGFCVDTVCCDSACTTPCMSCKYNVGPAGMCLPVLEGHDPDGDCLPTEKCVKNTNETLVCTALN